MTVGISNCKECGKEFKWRRASYQKPKIYCSMSCFNKQPKQYMVERHKKLRENEDLKLENVKKRFEKHVIRKEGCWDWKGCEHHSGYLPFNYFSTKNDLAHRVSWIIHNGEIPEGLCVCHKCDNRKCTNPDHLFLGSHQDNVNDMHKKNRGVYGEKHHRAKLDKEKVMEIRNLLKIGVKATRIARDYGVSDGTIYFIHHNITWRNI